MNTVHEGVWHWLRACGGIDDLFFGLARAGGGDTLLVPLTCGGDIELRRFIDGSSERQSVFSLSRFGPVTAAPNDDSGLAALEEAEKLAGWIREKRAAGAFPELPPGCLACDVYPLDTGAGFFAAAGENHAQYTFQFCVEYIRRGGV